MSKIAVVGGNGKIARLLHPLLREAGFEPLALVRTLDYAPELEALGAEVRVLDIENSDLDDYARAIDGASAVVFAAGGGPDGNIDRKRTVDLGGSLGAISGASAAGVRRFVQISAIAVDEPVAEDAAPVWQAYVVAKRQADEALRSSGLDWTILRPGGLTDDPATGTITLAQRVERGSVTRADVAATVVAALRDDRTIGHQWELVGGATPIPEAVDAAVSGPPAN